MVRHRTREAGRSAETGAVAVEGALVLSLFLVPLLVGLVFWGQYFWLAQRVSASDFEVPQGGVAGTLSCSQLVSRVRGLLAGDLATLGSQVGVPLTADALDVTVVRVLPDLGAEVQVSVTVPLVDRVGSLVPLPGGGTAVTSSSQLLSNVKVTTASC